MKRSVAIAGALALACAASAARAEPETWRLSAASGVGAGLRFQNPYRLSRVLGSDAASVSAIAPFADLTIAASYGETWRQGASLRWDAALSGVAQNVITPSYVFSRRWVAFEAYARFGVPIVLDPDPNAGLELGVGGAWFPFAGIGVGGELIGSGYQGAASPGDRHPIYPVLAGQLGLVIEWERLP